MSDASPISESVFLFRGSFDRDIDHEGEEADDDEFHDSDRHERIVSEGERRNKSNFGDALLNPQIARNKLTVLIRD